MNRDPVFEALPWHASPLRTYWGLYAGQRTKLLCSALIYLVKHSPAVLLPVITGLTIDKLAAHAPLAELWPYAVGVALLIAQNLPGHYFHVRLLSEAVRTVERSLRGALSQQIQQLSIGYYQRRSPATLQAKMLRDVEAVEHMTRALADGLLGSGSAIAVALCVTAWRAPHFLLLYLLTVPAACALVLATRSRLAQHNQEFRQAVEGMSSRVSEMTLMLPLTRAHALEAQALERVEDSFERVSDTGLRLDSINAWFNGLAWVSFQALNFICLGVAAWAYASQSVGISLGDVVLLSGFFTSLTGAVLGLTGTLPQINKGLEAIRSMAELMAADPGDEQAAGEPTQEREQQLGKRQLSQVSGRIECRQLSYHYPQRGATGARRPALQGIDLRIEPGETIALVGPSGSGKSTLANLVIGLLRPSGGQLLFDGHDMLTLDLRSWRRFLSVVPQDSVLLDASVRDNIAFGLGPLREDLLQDALAQAHCLEFVEQLPQGVDTLIGPQGVQLSGGQRQRLAIARALVRNPRVLVLDEASSALDHESEQLVLQSLARLRQGRSTLVIAHRLATVRDADRIIVLEGGRIVDSGSHQSLSTRCPLYARLLDAAAGPTTLQTQGPA